MTDQPFVENDEMPFEHHPIQYLPWLDTRTRYEVFQHRPGQSQRLAEWCGGEVAFVDELIVRVPTEPGVHAHAALGDFVVGDGEKFWVEPANGFNQRYWPVGRDPGWPHTCTQPWEVS